MGLHGYCITTLDITSMGKIKGFLCHLIGIAFHYWLVVLDLFIETYSIPASYGLK